MIRLPESASFAELSASGELPASGTPDIRASAGLHEGLPNSPEKQKILDATVYNLEALKPIELMGELKNPEVQKTMRLVCDSFGCTMEQLTGIIQRESGGNPKARSESGSQGFMQLTGSVFQDMYRIAQRQEDGSVKYRGRGIAEYLDNFQRIADPLLDRIRPKYPDFASTIESIQDLGPRDQSKFSTYTRSLQKLTYSSTARGEIEPNLIIGALYLDSINDRSANFLDNPRNQNRVRSVIGKLRSVSLEGVNEMLRSKGFAPIKEAKALKIIIEGIIADREKFQTLLTNYNYNGDASKDPDGSEHRVKYGLVVSISEDQLKQRNNLSA